MNNKICPMMSEVTREVSCIEGRCMLYGTVYYIEDDKWNSIEGCSLRSNLLIAKEISLIKSISTFFFDAYKDTL